MAFEYKIHYESSSFYNSSRRESNESVLKTHGDNGWELVSVVGDPGRASQVFYFKREKS